MGALRKKLEQKMIKLPVAPAHVNRELHVEWEQSKSNQIILMYKMDGGLRCNNEPYHCFI